MALLVAACTSSGVTTATEGSNTSFGDRFRSAMASGSATPAPAPVVGGTTNLDDCPAVTLRQGAATYTINSDSRDPSAMALRYQVSIGQTARECANVAGTLTIRVGMQGRVVLGPAGGPGTINVPIRYALVEEGPEPKTVYTKLHTVPVTIAEGQPHVTFTHIEEEMAVPMPSPGVFQRYVVYVGFDPLGAQERRPPARKRTPRQS